MTRSLGVMRSLVVILVRIAYCVIRRAWSVQFTRSPRPHVALSTGPQARYNKLGRALRASGLLDTSRYSYKSPWEELENKLGNTCYDRHLP
jgi:hypothetical protein